MASQLVSLLHQGHHGVGFVSVHEFLLVDALGGQEVGLVVRRGQPVLVLNLVIHGQA